MNTGAFSLDYVNKWMKALLNGMEFKRFHVIACFSQNNSWLFKDKHVYFTFADDDRNMDEILDIPGVTRSAEGTTWKWCIPLSVYRELSQIYSKVYNGAWSWYRDWDSSRPEQAIVRLFPGGPPWDGRFAMQPGVYNSTEIYRCTPEDFEEYYVEYILEACSNAPLRVYASGHKELSKDIGRIRHWVNGGNSLSFVLPYRGTVVE